MKCSLKATHPEEIEYTISLTATAKEFEELREKIDRNFYITQSLDKMISDLLIQANKAYNTKELKG